MPTIQQTATVEDWQSVIRVVTGCADRKQFPRIDRRLVFDAVQAILRDAIEGQENAANRNFSKLGKSTVEVAKEVAGNQPVAAFLKSVRSMELQSAGIHIVDPLSGRLSAIWYRPATPSLEELAKAELYARSWNRLYRRLFRPSASLINAIESGVLPWQWTDIFLRTKNPTGDNNEWYDDPFFKDTRELAAELSAAIFKCFPTNPDASDPQHVEAVFRSASNELERTQFETRLERVALRLRDQVIDDPTKREVLCNYLRECAGGVLPNDLDTELTANVERWGSLLVIIQALQSSILSQPMFCDSAGIWLHRIEFCNSPLLNRTSIYIIFGLTELSVKDDDAGLYRTAKAQFDNLEKAIDSVTAMPMSQTPKDSDLLRSLLKEITNHRGRIRYHEEGLQRWLSALDKLMAGAKHEGYPISYKVGYGSLAYAQTHLHRYEPAPDDLATSEASVERIASYAKGFYSIFGKSRGLWFDELGRYCGVYENADGRNFEDTVVGGVAQSQHEDTVLFAKIGGVGLIDILNRTTNQIARVKHGKPVDMVRGDGRRKKALKCLVADVVPLELRAITEKLADELMEQLQIGTHGTSFIVSFPEAVVRNGSRSWVSSIETQAKTLIRAFSLLEAPLATLQQLQDYANGHAKLEHVLRFLVELANLDGGLWLELSEAKGLVVKAAQQFIPLLKLPESKVNISDDPTQTKKVIVRPFDLQMDHSLLGDQSPSESSLPDNPLELFGDLNGIKSLFAAINGHIKVDSWEKKKYINALSFLNHSGTKTHSLWGMSMTAAEPCLCVVISSDGNVYVFHDGREFAGLQDE